MKTKPTARKGHTTAAVRIGGPALEHAKAYAQSRNVTLRYAVETILKLDRTLDHCVEEALTPSGSLPPQPVRPARRMPAKRKTEASTTRPKGAHPSPHANRNR